MQRDKGKAGELEFIKLVRHLTADGVVLERNLGQSRSGGDDLNGHPLFSFEIKRRKSVTDAMVTGWWQQAVDQALTRGKQPVLAWRQDKAVLAGDGAPGDGRLQGGRPQGLPDHGHRAVLPLPHGA